MLPSRIKDVLNNGEAVVADVPVSGDLRCFVRIRPIPNPAVPRDHRRYLNSGGSMWEYWWYDFRRFVLKPGWEEIENDYDLFITSDARLVTKSEDQFYDALRRWVPLSVALGRFADSACPE